MSQSIHDERVLMVTVICSRIQPYLGMNIEVVDHQVAVDMIFYIEQLLSEVQAVGNYNTPAIKEFFQPSKESPLLDDVGRQKFDTIVAKLLYLAKRLQPDLLTATSFLCTRVKQPTKADQCKTTTGSYSLC